jgi:hypothetical protein
LDVGNGKGRGVGRGTGVFARAHQEEKGNGEHVANGEVVGGANGGGGGKGMEDDGNWDGFDSMGRRIGAGVATELALETTVDGAKRI